VSLQPVDLLISGGLVVTVDPAWTVHEEGSVAVDRGRIVGVGPKALIESKFAGRQRLEARDRLVMPGLINTHTHAAMTIFRGMADDVPLKVWLDEHIWPAEIRFIRPETVRWGTLLAAAEMIAAGITTFCDMYPFADAVTQAARQAGLRVVAAQHVINFQSPDHPGPQDALKKTRTFIEKWRDDPLVRPAVGPHAPYSLDEGWLRASKRLADQYGVPLSIHVSETAGEVEESHRQHGVSPVEHLDRLGVLDENVVAAHCVWVTPKDIEILKRRQVGVAHNPRSNLKLGSGVAPVPDMLAAGLKVGLGTDGAASSNDLSIFGEMETAGLLHKGIRRDPTLVDARSIVRMATLGGAEVLGLDGETGSVEEGKCADLILINLNHPRLVPTYDIYSHLAYAMDEGDVETVIVNGQILMRERQLLTLDVEEIVAQVRRIAACIAMG